ncbi:hypothetical protein PR202_gb05051 [Eleusine coracana subsp. coracana]|uniref:MHD domain-containing protein n=1 Tax=Eleusine coracana subsp. coracana TaxID=191504 RepID=A0AAV5E5A6_ELECO|nr:hypothetical protein PR202_gb05051 [Eleusine coracana subsp. coracana]
MAGAVSALFLLDIKGRVLVWRDYRGDVSALQAERFFTKLLDKEVFKHYFEELEEESLRDNFVVVYELLDEMMDFGYPQYTEAKILSEFIKTDAYRMEVSQRPPMAVTNAVSWRSEGIRYKKNEVFLDVVESVNILVNSNGQIVRSDVVGALKMRTYLRGGKQEAKDTWWWNDKVQRAIKEKKECFKRLHLDKSATNIEGYKIAKRAAKRAVSVAKGQAYDNLYQRLGTKEGEKDIYRMARIRERKTRDINQIKCIKDGVDRLLTLCEKNSGDRDRGSFEEDEECGMPECKLGLNDRVLLEAQGRATKGKAIDLDDIKFHQCVRLARFENDRTISFIPPDGSFDLMTYRLSTQVKPLIWVEAQIEKHSRSRIELMVKARSQFKERSTATNVEIEVPVPLDATNPNIRTSMGSASYAPERDAMVWKVKSFPGGKEYMCRAEFSLPSITAEEAVPEKKAPIRVKFEIPYFTVSGIQVRYLKIIEKSGYQALPWVRYITMAGEYELRLI